MQSRYAEEANYWDTTVHPAKSQGEIVEMLEDFQAESVMMAQGTAGGRYAWMVRFQWQGRSYRFSFTPLECMEPQKLSRFGGKQREHSDQARYQMGRVAVHFVKAILTAAEAHPGALFGFMELPASATRAGGIPNIVSELEIGELVEKAKPWIQIPPVVVTGAASDG